MERSRVLKVVAGVLGVVATGLLCKRVYLKHKYDLDTDCIENHNEDIASTEDRGTECNNNLSNTVVDDLGTVLTEDNFSSSLDGGVPSDDMASFGQIAILLSDLIDTVYLTGDSDDAESCYDASGVLAIDKFFNDLVDKTDCLKSINIAYSDCLSDTSDIVSSDTSDAEKLFEDENLDDIMADSDINIDEDLDVTKSGDSAMFK